MIWTMTILSTLLMLRFPHYISHITKTVSIEQNKMKLKIKPSTGITGWIQYISFISPTVGSVEHIMIYDVV